MGVNNGADRELCELHAQGPQNDTKLPSFAGSHVVPVRFRKNDVHLCYMTVLVKDDQSR